MIACELKHVFLVQLQGSNISLTHFQSLKQSNNIDLDVHHYHDTTIAKEVLIVISKWSFKCSVNCVIP